MGLHLLTRLGYPRCAYDCSLGGVDCRGSYVTKPKERRFQSVAIGAHRIFLETPRHLQISPLPDARPPRMLAQFASTSTRTFLRVASSQKRLTSRPTKLTRFSPNSRPPTRNFITKMSSTLGKTGTPGNTAVADVSETGAFVRKEAGFRNRIEKGGAFPPESGRYHVYVSLACPWACRVVSTIGLKGLGDHVSWSAVHPTWQKTKPLDESDTHAGWAFAEAGTALSSPSGCGSFSGPVYDSDPIHGGEIKFVRDLYEKVGAPEGTRFTVPVLWDKKNGTIVSNESSEIMRDLNDAFDDVLAGADTKEIDLYPPALQSEIDSLNAWIYEGVNNGVYKSGFAVSQGAYETAVTELFACLDRIDDILGKRRYIAGDQLTEADVRLFPTLVRFDPVYIVYFKCAKKALREYKNIPGYIRDVYQTPGIKPSVNFWHIKTHYFTSHPVLNANAIVPIASEWDIEGPHGRDGEYPR